MAPAGCAPLWAGGQPALGEPLKFHPKAVPPRPDPEYVDRINIVDRGLNSDFAIGAGTILSLRGASARPTTDAVWEMRHQLNPGSEYTALIYDPQPSASVMRSAGTRYPDTARSYTTFSLAPGGAHTVVAPLWGRSGPPSIGGRVNGTPYAGMYALAGKLAAGARDPFDAVHRVDIYLRTHLNYRQNVPGHAYPLPAFLSQDRAGYCQQFSGTMALMLRMLGIPSRVATGFAPGGRDPERNNFLVDDTDAHDWVEVFFPSIGWVTFDPTPGAAPAATQLDDNALGVTKSPTPAQKSTGPAFPDSPSGPLALHKRSTAGTGGPGAKGSEPSLDRVRRGAAQLALAAARVRLAALAPQPPRSRSPRRGRARRARPGAGADRVPAAAGRHAAPGGGPARRPRRNGCRPLRRAAQGRALRAAGLRSAGNRRAPSAPPRAGESGRPPPAAAGAARDPAGRP